MTKTINWNTEAARATRMTDEALAYARADAHAAAVLWNDPDTDPDRNYGFYMDQCSVYATEQKRRV